MADETSFVLRVTSTDPRADAAQLEELALQLRDELRSAGRYTVVRQPSGAAPDNARSAEAILAGVGFVLTTGLTTVAAAADIVTFVQDWRSRHPRRRRLSVSVADVDVSASDGTDAVAAAIGRRGTRVRGWPGRRRSALLIANATYVDSGLKRLRSPVQDVRGLADVLSAPAIGGFDVDLLVDADERTIRRKLAAFFANRDPDDLLLLHFSCHGLKDQRGRLHLAASDTDLQSLTATAVPASFINDLMTETIARRVVLILDCCYSGAFARGAAVRGERSVHVAEEFGGGTGRIVLTASSATEYAFEGDRVKHFEATPSVFCEALVAGLATGEADLDNDGDITVDELYRYVHRRVIDARKGQQPHMSAFGVAGSLVLAHSVLPPATPAPPPVSVPATPKPPAKATPLKTGAPSRPSHDPPLSRPSHDPPPSRPQRPYTRPDLDTTQSWIRHPVVFVAVVVAVLGSAVQALQASLMPGLVAESDFRVFFNGLHFAALLPVAAIAAAVRSFRVRRTGWTALLSMLAVGLLAALAVLSEQGFGFRFPLSWYTPNSTLAGQDEVVERAVTIAGVVVIAAGLIITDTLNGPRLTRSSRVGGLLAVAGGLVLSLVGLIALFGERHAIFHLWTAATSPTVADAPRGVTAVFGIGNILPLDHRGYATDAFAVAHQFWPAGWLCLVAAAALAAASASRRRQYAWAVAVAVPAVGSLVLGTMAGGRYDATAMVDLIQKLAGMSVLAAAGTTAYLVFGVRGREPVSRAAGSPSRWSAAGSAVIILATVAAVAVSAVTLAPAAYRRDNPSAPAEVIRTLPHTGDPRAFAFHPDGATLVSAEADGTLRSWDIASGQQAGLPVPMPAWPVQALAYSGDGTYLVTTHVDKALRLWNAADLTEVGLPIRPPAAPNQAVFTSLARHQLVALTDGELAQYPITKGRVLSPAKVTIPDRARTFAASGNGGIVIVGCGKGTARVYDMTKRPPALVGTPLKHGSGTVLVAMTRDATAYVTAGDDGAVQVWSASNQQPLGEAMPGRAGAPRSMALSPDGRTIAVAYDSGLIRLWDLASRSAVGGPLEAHPASAEYVAFSPAGDLLASGGADGTIRVWRLPG